MNSFFAQIAAVFVALKLVPTVGYDAVARASYHLALVTNAVAFGWGHGAEQDAENTKLAEQLQIARDVLTYTALEYGLYEAYQHYVTLNNHWRLPGRAPSVAGLPDYNIHWDYLDEEGTPHRHERVA